MFSSATRSAGWRFDSTPPDTRSVCGGWPGRRFTGGAVRERGQPRVPRSPRGGTNCRRPVPCPPYCLSS